VTDEPTPLVRRAESVEYETVSAAEGLQKGVLIDESDGAPHFAIRRFSLAPGAEVPTHTNAVEHEQYVLSGGYVVGIGESDTRVRVDGDTVEGGTRIVVSAGDSLLIPAGVPHWYRNDTEEPGAFLCAVPNGDDAIELVE